MSEVTFTVKKYHPKRIKKVLQSFFLDTRKNISKDELDKVIANYLKKNITWFKVVNNTTGVETEYKKDTKDKNYSVRTLTK